MVKTTIKDLKKNDRFKFNYDKYVVKRKYKDDDKPLIAYNERRMENELFHNEDLEIEKYFTNDFE